jgi:hypothetical protein
MRGADVIHHGVGNEQAPAIQCSNTQEHISVLPNGTGPAEVIAKPAQSLKYLSTKRHIGPDPVIDNNTGARISGEIAGELTIWFNSSDTRHSLELFARRPITGAPHGR